MRVNRMCRELRKKDVLQTVLRAAHDRSLAKYSSVDDEDDFQEVLDPPAILPSTQYQLSLAFPDLSQHKVQDLFADLGPVAIFNARHFWSAPRAVKLRKREHDLDEAALKPYLQLDRMIEAAFACANRLFGLEFKPLEAKLIKCGLLSCSKRNRTTENPCA